MQRFLARTIAILLAVLPAAGHCGQEPAGAGLAATAQAASGWQAVGRVDFANRGWCTGALIAEDLVLTAAHCLYDPSSGQRFLTSEISFRPGGDRSAPAFAIRRTVTHPDFTYSAEDQIGRVAHDLALLRLDRPAGGIAPLAIDERPRRGAEVGVVSYAAETGTTPGLSDGCEVMARQGGVLVLGCAVAPGASGAPVFALEEGSPRIVSVISAMARVRDRDVALGTALSRPLAELREALAAQVKPEPRQLVGSRDPGIPVAALDSGAKFLRPGN